MGRLALRGLRERKGRTLYVMLSVVLGVALIAGAYVFTDTINRTFDRLVADSNRGTDVKVVPRKTDVDTQEQPTLAAALLPRVRRAPGVARASGSLSSQATIVGRDGKPASTLGSAITSVLPRRFEPYSFTGRQPRTADEVAVDKGTASRNGWRLGDRVQVVGDAGARSYRLVGISRLGEASSLGGLSLAVLTLPEVQRLAEQRGRLTEIYVAGNRGVTPEALRSAVATSVGGAPVQVRTGEEDTRKQSADIRKSLGFLAQLLLIFGFVSLVVGAFSIFNTFGITVAQRTREFALLRVVGAERGQVLRAVLLEALFVGVVGSLLGLGLGIVLAPALKELFTSVGLDLPSTSPVVLPRTVIVALVVGTVVTLAAALVPALRAMRVAPVVALREGALAPARRPGRRRLALGVVVLALGLALVAIGAIGGGNANSVLALMGVGSLLAFIGVAALSTTLVVPLANALGTPLERAGGVAARMARGNAVRNPSRTAGTASALMVGVALVALVTVLAAGLKGSFSGAFEKAVRADYVVATNTGLVPAGVPRALRRVRGVQTATGLGGAQAKLARGGGSVQVSGLDPRAAPRVVDVPWTSGSDATLNELGTTGAALDEGWAEDHDLAVGDRFVLVSASDRRVPLVVRGLYDDKGGLFGPVTVTTAALRREFGARRDFAVLLRTDPTGPAVQRRLDRTLDREFPTLDAKPRQQFIDDQIGQVNRIVTLFYSLLSLAVIIALMGIANTLALTIHERTRELGVLRAVGATKRQVAGMVRGEALITALIGATVGILLGIAFGAIISVPLAKQGFAFALPVGTLVVVLVLAAIAGVLAAWSPSRRAAKTDMLAALGYE